MPGNSSRAASQHCRSAVGSFPDQRDALHQLSESHFFVLPTLNENFGYVFIEALAAGCPLLVSENTVWKDIEQRGVGWQIPLKRTDLWVDQINECVAMAASPVRNNVSGSPKLFGRLAGRPSDRKCNGQRA